MKYYKFTQDQLENFAKKVYEEACCGYMDLKESVCNMLVHEFISKQQLVLPIDTNIMEQEYLNRYFDTGQFDVYNEDIVASTSTTSSSIGDSFEFLTSFDQVRPEEHIRIDQNF